MKKDNPGFLRHTLRNWRRSSGFRKGLPAGFPEDKFADFVRSTADDVPVSVSHRHVSGWKSAGAFRVRVKLERGEHWTFIFKDAIYDSEQIPALTGLPLQPGPPEYWIYQSYNSTLQKYLPKVYFCKRYPDSLRYQYFLEDLRPEFRPVAGEDDIFTICRLLPCIQEVLSGSIAQEIHKNLLNFDIEFSANLLRYAATNLNRLHEMGGSSFGKLILGKWPEIEDLYLSNMEMAYTKIRPQIIHGDSNLSNILISQSAPGDIRLIDWEWAGIGLPQMDLTSVLKNVSPQIEAAALRIYDQNITSGDLRSNFRIFQWCKLQRGLFDAAFFLKQTTSRPTEKISNLDDHIEKAFSRALQAASALSEIR